MDTIQAVFEEGGFPGDVGVIDGTHISIRAPTEEPDTSPGKRQSYCT